MGLDYTSVAGYGLVVEEKLLEGSLSDDDFYEAPGWFANENFSELGYHYAFEMNGGSRGIFYAKGCFSSHDPRYGDFTEFDEPNKVQIAQLMTLKNILNVDDCKIGYFHFSYIW